MSTRQLLIGSLLCFVGAAPLLAATTDQARLATIEQQARERFQSWRGHAYAALSAKKDGPLRALLADAAIELFGVLPSGRPLFIATENVDAAATVATDLVWPGGSAGLDLSGANPLGSLAIWDGGAVRIAHQEFTGRAVSGDGSSNVSSHATHVAGTMIAAGADPDARGMSFAGTLQSYDWGDDTGEMAAAAAGLLCLSNHSYGYVAGWRYGWSDPDAWYWFGDPTVSEIEDPGFGFYDPTAAAWDDLAHAAPYYLIVKSAGNDRSDAGPEPGGGHYAWSDQVNDWVWSTVVRDPDGGADGFDSIPYHGTAKNILTVGAVLDIPGGWTSPDDVQVSAFSSWGPTDDGRVKPDLVANGVSLYSSIASGDAEYARYSGTSMSAPNVTGSLNLLVEHYRALHGGQRPLASTLKAIVLHTASEAGPTPGPDFMHGWGLLNTAAAALMISDDAAGGRRLRVATLADGTADLYRFYHDGDGELKVTLAWTDPAGSPPAWSLNPTTPMLVNDLDLKLVRESDNAVFWPWLLDPAAPAAPAVTGPNHRDNVEMILATGAGAGTYLVEVSHSGSLQGGQTYSLVVSGLRPLSVTAAPAVIAASRLLHAAPNPFNPRTEIAFELAHEQAVQVAIFDPRGRRVSILAERRLPAGRHRLAWDGRDAAGRDLAAGVYLVRLQAGVTVDRMRVLLVR
ncbi:MAG: S8 family serine peptidase [Candidatus Krumholzibacteria bacterium]|jgi:hypothetical protein|nr:S8 family serine peptidase [Candidatus Krumholzibacteria bacterium]